MLTDGYRGVSLATALHVRGGVLQQLESSAWHLMRRAHEERLVRLQVIVTASVLSTYFRL
jgi:hypothetical protein